jgi:hypothetical protein
MRNTGLRHPAIRFGRDARRPRAADGDISDGKRRSSWA